jgi:hypothetical protein
MYEGRTATEPGIVFGHETFDKCLERFTKVVVHPGS